MFWMKGIIITVIIASHVFTAHFEALRSVRTFCIINLQQYVSVPASSQAHETVTEGQDPVYISM